MDGFCNFICAGIETVNNCPIGNVPKLLVENEDFWQIFLKMLPGLIYDNGGVNYASAQIIIDALGIEKTSHAVIYDKINICAVAIREAQEREREKARKK